MGLQLDSVLFHDLNVCSYANAVYFDCCSFVVTSEIEKWESSNFVLFQVCFGYSGSLAIPYEF